MLSLFRLDVAELARVPGPGDDWYRIALPTGVEGWVQAAVSSANDTGSDGRPSSVRFDLLATVTAF